MKNHFIALQDVATSYFMTDLGYINFSLDFENGPCAGTTDEALGNSAVATIRCSSPIQSYTELHSKVTRQSESNCDLPHVTDPLFSAIIWNARRLLRVSGYRSQCRKGKFTCQNGAQTQLEFAARISDVLYKSLVSFYV